MSMAEATLVVEDKTNSVKEVERAIKGKEPFLIFRISDAMGVRPIYLSRCADNDEIRFHTHKKHTTTLRDHSMRYRMVNKSRNYKGDR